jgi:NAD(P)-dependent dehydrogenase (short-subunit alcohol dehydrogenase family)
MRIITTGNPTYGLAEAISRRLGGDFASRANGYDLCSDDGRKRFVETSHDYDVFINSAALWRFHQSLLLEAVWGSWSERGKTGHIISIGSTADTGVRSGKWLYPIEKKALKDLNRNMTYSSIGGNNIRVSLLSFGYLSTPKVEEKHPTKNKISCDQAVDIIEWVLKSPPTVNINEVSVDPLQQGDR